jgi:hypothetical protein
MTDATTWRNSRALLLADFGATGLRAMALGCLGLAAAGCGPAGSHDSAPPPPVETRELDASQTQRTMQPLD